MLQAGRNERSHQPAPRSRQSAYRFLLAIMWWQTTNTFFLLNKRSPNPGGRGFLTDGSVRSMLLACHFAFAIATANTFVLVINNPSSTTTELPLKLESANWSTRSTVVNNQVKFGIKSPYNKHTVSTIIIRIIYCQANFCSIEVAFVTSQ
jgi:hypothetical protein